MTGLCNGLYYSAAHDVHLMVSTSCQIEIRNLSSGDFVAIFHYLLVDGTVLAFQCCDVQETAVTDDDDEDTTGKSAGEDKQRRRRRENPGDYDNVRRGMFRTGRTTGVLDDANNQNRKLCEVCVRVRVRVRVFVSKKS